jgi:hypothetical protein
MSRNFDFYEYAGIIIPGTVLVMALVWLFPESRALFSKEGVTLGELGLFVIIAYAAGQLVQAIGNGLEWVLWKLCGGMPSGQVLCGKYLSADQHKRLLEALRPVVGDADPCKLPEPERLAIAREVYSEIAGAGKASRVDTFNGNYGLMRGLAAAFVMTFALAIVTSQGIIALCVVAVLFLLAIYRMHRFGRHYATELFTQFLVAKGKDPAPASKSSSSGLP